MEIIILYPVSVRGGEQLLIRIPEVQLLIELAKRLPGVKWSSMYKAWYMPLNRLSYETIRQRFHKLALVNTEHLRSYLLKKRSYGSETTYFRNATPGIST